MATKDNDLSSKIYYHTKQPFNLTIPPCPVHPPPSPPLFPLPFTEASTTPLFASSVYAPKDMLDATNTSVSAKVLEDKPSIQDVISLSRPDYRMSPLDFNEKSAFPAADFLNPPPHEIIENTPPPPGMMYCMSRSVVGITATIYRGRGNSDGSLWLLKRRPSFGGRTLRLQSGMRVRFSDLNVGIEGVVGRVVSWEREWMIFRLKARNTKGTGDMWIATPFDWGRMDMWAFIKYTYLVLFDSTSIPNTLPPAPTTVVPGLSSIRSQGYYEIAFRTSPSHDETSSTEEEDGMDKEEV